MSYDLGVGSAGFGSVCFGLAFCVRCFFWAWWCGFVCLSAGAGAACGVNDGGFAGWALARVADSARSAARPVDVSKERVDVALSLEDFKRRASASSQAMLDALSRLNAAGAGDLWRRGEIKGEVIEARVINPGLVRGEASKLPVELIPRIDCLRRQNRIFIGSPRRARRVRHTTHALNVTLCFASGNPPNMNQHHDGLVKVPEVTFVFWLVKIAATTLGETGGDAVSVSMGLGYLAGTAIFALVFLAAVSAQVRARSFRPPLYWLTIIATTTVGTTAADYADRSLGIGYPGGSALLLLLLISTLAVWYGTLGTIAVESISTPKAETFYWVAIMFSQTLGTALGDWTADTQGLGYSGSALVFGGILALLAIAYRWTRLSRTVLFWSAFVLTRPLGAVLGDLLDKPLDHGGLALSRYSTSMALLATVVVLLTLFPQRTARKSH